MKKYSPEDIPKNINQLDNKIQWAANELATILNRAEKLSASELKELTELVGIQFTDQPEQVRPKEEYIDVLDEANNKEVLLNYLAQKGV